MSYLNRKSFKTPMILDADSYKYGHWLQLPKGTKKAYGYGGSRGGKYSFFVQGPVIPFLIKLQDELNCLSISDIDMAKDILDKHLGPGIFNYQGWIDVLTLKERRLPIKLYCLDEGQVVPGGVPTFRVETDIEFAWLEGFMETCLLRHFWYGSTVATISMACKLAIMPFVEETCDDIAVIDFMLHDFAYRGVSSDESAQMGSMSHGMFWKGTDTVAALWAMREFYGADVSMYSVLATEHTTTTANSDAANRDDEGAIEMAVSLLENRCKQYGFSIVACVNDTYDDERHVKLLGTKYKNRIMNSGGRFVTRCDSGDPIANPIKICEMLLNDFGYAVNTKGYKVLPGCIRVLQGDGVDERSIRQILSIAERKGISAENFVFGMGGALLQHCDRDWMKVAMKCSALMIGEAIINIFKAPKNAPDKKSFAGIVTTVREADGTIVCKDIRDIKEGEEDLLKLVWDGNNIANADWNKVLKTAEASFKLVYKNLL